ncbi:murein biosynthesis integral membrane protein MurJ [Catelliglobosispora koreensis]|uniref:murein biosynthesis integral membrane protein MurJ n=1 Tax=Catelliglobosispora koreensis TaxID=129052 RepID=UPI000374A6D4|nr:lipid II flippase MurJ [Catelliglobosispora koreensis]
MGAAVGEVTAGTGRAAAGIAAAATMIALITVASRVFGFGRNIVLLFTVGPTALGDVYNAAAAIPNIIFEIVAGGALAGLVVPLLAKPLAEGDRETVRKTASSLLTWTMLILTPLAILQAVFASPIMNVLGTANAPQHAAGVTMLRVFAPMVLFYGVGIVLTGVLQAHRKFAWPALAPLLSSVTVMASYVIFALVAGTKPDLATVSKGEVLILAVGTALAAAVLSGCLLIPVHRLGVKLRPRLEFSDAQRKLVAGLAAAGLVTIGVQQIARLVTIRLSLAANDGTQVVFSTAQAMFLLPWAVLAVPLATASYPAIATAHATGEVAQRNATVAKTGRGVVLLGCLGAALLTAVAYPLAGLLIRQDPMQAQWLGAATMAFAPGLYGYSVSALHQRTLYAAGAQRFAAVAIGLGWTVTIAASVIFSRVFAEPDRAMALGAANSVGMTVLGGALAFGVWRKCGAEALKGVGKVTFAGVGAATVAIASALLLESAIDEARPGVWELIWQGTVSAVTAAVVFAGMALLLDREDSRAAWKKLRGWRTRAGKGGTP